MKAERLLAILTILLNRKKVTASWLAAHFGVSARTIYRDVDALAGAGLPVFATQGRDGGFELVEGFTLSEQILDTGEIQQILAGLRSLTAVQSSTVLDTVIEKFTLALNQSEKHGIRCPQNHIFIELTPSHREKRILGRIEESIKNGTVLSIAYSDGGGSETERSIEPLALVFMWQSWYAYSWCRLRGDYRLFRISRIHEASPSPEKRESANVDLSERLWALDWEAKPFERVVLTADRVARNKLCEFFDSEDISYLPDGNIRVESRMPVDEWVLSFIMSLPGNIRILEPETMRAAIRDRAETLFRENTRSAEP